MIHRVRVKKALCFTYPHYGFFVGLKLQGEKVKAQGQLIEKIVSVAEQKHYLKDEGAPKSKVAAITKPKSTFRFVASGIVVDSKRI